MHKSIKIELNGSWPDGADNWDGTVTVNGKIAEFWGDGDALRGWFVKYSFIYDMKVYFITIYLDNKIELEYEDGDSMYVNKAYRHNLQILLNGEDVTKSNLI